MPNQEQSRDGIPRKDDNRPSPDGQKGGEAPGSQDYRGDGPGKPGLTSDNQPDLVAPSGVNERDGAPVEGAGGALDFDDGTDMVHPRGKVTSAGRTANEKNPSDAGDLGAPNAGMSDRNGPSDPDAKRSR
ncbi:serine/threonine protein kinase [Ramlibacter sp. PS3R-8]|uniref:serine/threonine protein kinase n=1 Tax=Ramlibacter sp. PS3R-8 TaxID=3133437 RepID=UPI0030A59225